MQEFQLCVSPLLLSVVSANVMYAMYDTETLFVIHVERLARSSEFLGLLRSQLASVLHYSALAPATSTKRKLPSCGGSYNPNCDLW